MRKKPIVPLCKHYSRDLKDRVVYQSEVLCMKSTEVAINLDIPLWVVQHVKRTWHEIREVCRDRHAAIRAPFLKPEHCKCKPVPSSNAYFGQSLDQVLKEHHLRNLSLSLSHSLSISLLELYTFTQNIPCSCSVSRLSVSDLIIGSVSTFFLNIVQGIQNSFFIIPALSTYVHIITITTSL